MNRADIHWPSRIGSWVVLAIGLLVAVFLTATWTDALLRFFGADMVADPALANEATLAPNAFSGVFLASAAVATIPLGAGLWGLWHLHRQLAERGLGHKLGIGLRLRTIGLGLMAAAIVVAGLALAFQSPPPGPGGLPVLPSHIAIFAVGLLVWLFGLWRGRRAP